MKMKNVVLLAVALSCGLVAMLGVRQAMSGRKAGLQEETVSVLVAAADIAPGVPLDETNTVFKQWKKENVPEGVVTTDEQFQDRALKIRAVAGEPIMQAKLGEKGVVGASIEIPDGMRVVTVPVDTTMSHSGMMLPGDKVDVYVTYKVRTEGGQLQKTKVILQAIKVFAAGSVREVASAEVPEINAKNVSVLVTPDQASILLLAKNKGTLHLALRPPGSDDQQKVADVTESIFEDDPNLSQTVAHYEPQEGNPQPAPSVKSMLQQEQADQQGTPEPVEDLGPEMWSIQVYEGNQLRVEEVEDPELTETKNQGKQNQGKHTKRKPIPPVTQVDKTTVKVQEPTPVETSKAQPVELDQETEELDEETEELVKSMMKKMQKNQPLQ